jgi:hypothetical protein
VSKVINKYICRMGNNTLLRVLMQLSILICCLCTNSMVSAQNGPEYPNYYTGSQFPMQVNSQFVGAPFTGGFNNGLVAELDVNNDGLEDAILFDKDYGQSQVWVKTTGGQYQYSPDLELALPKCKHMIRIADLNSDGKMDIFTCNESWSILIYRNITATSDETAKFEPVGYYIPELKEHAIFYLSSPSRDTTEPWAGYSRMGTASADYPYIGDVDGDGDVDLVYFDAFYGTYSLIKDTRAERGLNKDTFDFQVMDYCFGYFYENFEGKLVFGKCNFTAKLKPRHVSGSSTLMYDIDGDGDKELLSSSGVFDYITYTKNGKKEVSHYYDTMVSADTLFPSGNTRANQLFFPSISGLDYNDDGIIDFITTSAEFEKNQAQNNFFLYEGYKVGLEIKHKIATTNPFINTFADFGSYSAPGLLDIDGDGDLDLLVAAQSNDNILRTNAIFKVYAFINEGTVKAPRFIEKLDFNLNISGQGITYPKIATGDLNNDGKEDILIGSNTGKLYFYQNNGNISFNLVDSTFISPLNIREWVAAPALFDYDGDGLLDIVVGYEKGNVGVFRNTGTATSPSFNLESKNAWNVQSNKFLTNINPPAFEYSGFASPWVGDIDNDGKNELLLAGGGGEVYRYNIDKMSLGDSLPRELNMFWTKYESDSAMAFFGGFATIAAGDIDGDSINEIFIGSKSGGLKVMSSKPFKSTINTGFAKSLKFIVFPNPNKGELNVVIPGVKGNTVYEIYHIGGALLQKGSFNGNTHSIDISSYNNGMYFIQLNTNGVLGSKKFMLTR